MGETRVEQHHIQDRHRSAELTLPDLKVWDTEYAAPSKVFGMFREGVASAFMPWTPELKFGQDFNARIESVALRKGTVSRIRVTPHVTSRTLQDIAKSEAECVYAVFLLDGTMTIEQGGRSTVTRQGDLALFTSERPATVTQHPETLHHALVLLIPNKSLDPDIECADSFNNIVVPREKIIGPLATCASFISEHLLSTSQDELCALVEASISLLPFAKNFGMEAGKDKIARQPQNYLIDALLNFVNQNISNPGLSPQEAAVHLGISPRYVHKLFAGSALTFSCYVTARRLDHIRRELASPSCRRQPISALAYRWGFEDLSTFNRAFKQRFGCTPTQYRLQGRF